MKDTGNGSKKNLKTNEDMKHIVHGVYQVIFTIRLKQCTKTSLVDRGRLRFVNEWLFYSWKLIILYLVIRFIN